MAAEAAPLTLSTAPAGTVYKLPAPNVIVSVDDSGSMGATGIATLQAALRGTFSAAHLADGRIRLAWQSMNGCPGIPNGNANCLGRNAMKVFSGQHRTDFMAWVATLAAAGGTPAHIAVRNAGDYLRQTNLGVNSPWAKEPGKQEAPILSCRRSYHLFMTDGAWGSTGASTDQVIDGDRRTTGYKASELGGGNLDGTRRLLGDGHTTYTPDTGQTRLYSDPWGTEGSDGLNTLSDLSFHYWATDLQPGIPNELTPKTAVDGDETVRADGRSVVLDKFWNPRNDPATWQHLVTYTIGFGSGATGWTGAPAWGTDTHTGPGYTALLLGSSTWPSPLCGAGDTPCDGAASYGMRDNERKVELWHMALNGRGKFIPAPTADSLAPAFQDILGEIVQDQTAPVTALAVNSRSTRVNGAAFVSSYDAKDWSGAVTAYSVAAGSSSVSSTGAWGTVAATGTTPARPRSTATLMDDTSFSPTARVVLSAQTDAAGTTQGISWDWSQLDATKKAELNTSGGVADTRGELRVAYIRGSHAQEASQTPAGPFRARASRHGDIDNSALWYTPGAPDAGYTTNGYPAFATAKASRKPMVYVGANDGMLHGFDARLGSDGGTERIAYIPEGLNAALPALTRPGYTHRYYVDGSPFTADASIGSTWKTYLAGFPGLGGRGYFVLDVTDPDSFSAANAASLVVLDKTRTAGIDADIGHITGKPVTDQAAPSRATQITRLNNGRWALVMGNGYNSASEKAVLLIQYLDGSKELLKLTADSTAGGGNGLAPPQLVDLNGDRIPDVAYAGDLKGRLWKFDLSSAGAGDWQVAFGGVPLFIAKDANDAAQPITTAPGWMFHPNGGLMLAFGTGRDLTAADRGNTQRQTLYGVWDSTGYTLGSEPNTATGSKTVILGTGNNAVTDGRTVLVEQTVSAGVTATTAGNETQLWTVSSNPVPYTGTGARKGWYLDLPTSAEKALDAAQWLEGRLFSFPSTVPATGGNPDEESCDPSATSGKSFLTTLNVLNGSAPNFALYGYHTPPSEGHPSRAEDPTGGASVPLPAGGQNPEHKCIAAPGVHCDDRKSGGFTSQKATWRQAR